MPLCGIGPYPALRADFPQRGKDWGKSGLPGCHLGAALQGQADGAAVGDLDEAGALLGHQYAIDGAVEHGDHRGRTIGFPTANLRTENALLPPNGVYATTATVDGIVRPSVTNIGVRPTVDQSGQLRIETHLFDIDQDLYGKTIRLAFIQRLRDERTFDGLDALRAQIAADCERARVLLSRLSL